MQDPSYRNIALLPVLTVLTGGVIALGTLVGQGSAASQDCGPGMHSMAGMDHSMGDMSSMPGMDHSRHMAMGGDSTGCMDGSSMEDMGGQQMPGMAH